MDQTSTIHHIPEFQVLIGILTMMLNAKERGLWNLVSSPYRYSNNVTSANGATGEKDSFKSL
jgi:hypothetical protein